ncbi:hypothetical protein [Hymenobacter terricola]|uniref:hypothetical protein n=1 Tax=Hymenobacter terricola TaxID=2819236 RepID=UPI001B302BA9|nr:hypothetical protein [Hymenobacter terricola]
MAKNKKWVITTSGKHSLHDVQQQLSAMGFSVEQVLTEIGSITGAAPDEVAQRAKALPGVADVSPDTDINLGPPDDPVTW